MFDGWQHMIAPAVWLVLMVWGFALFVLHPLEFMKACFTLPLKLALLPVVLVADVLTMAGRGVGRLFRR